MGESNDLTVAGNSEVESACETGTSDEGSIPSPLPSIPGLWNCTNEVYFADKEYLTNSMLKDFKKSIPYFFEVHIAQTIKREPTPAMVLGTVVHALVLEPNEAGERFLVYPEGDGRKTEIKEARQRIATEARKTGKAVITADQWITAGRLRDSAWNRKKHPEIVEILEVAGWNEQALRVEDEEWGKRKAKYDKLVPAGHGCDIKTSQTVDPIAFARSAYNLGYHRAQAHYQDVLDVAFGEGLGRFFHIVLCTEEPYEAVIYEMDIVDQALGRRENQRLMTELQKRREADDWRTRWKGIQKLRLPAYAHRQEETGEEDED